jgi:hypothetical protein
MAIRSKLSDYVTANRIRARCGITDSVILRLVASGKIRVHVETGQLPLYHLGDVINAIKTLPPHANRKRRNGTAAPAAKRAKPSRPKTSSN